MQLIHSSQHLRTYIVLFVVHVEYGKVKGGGNNNENKSERKYRIKFAVQISSNRKKDRGKMS